MSYMQATQKNPTDINVRLLMYDLTAIHLSLLI